MMQMAVEEANAGVAKRFPTIVRKRNEAAKCTITVRVFEPAREEKRNLALFNFAFDETRGRKMTGVVVTVFNGWMRRRTEGGGSSQLVFAKENSFLIAQAARERVLMGVEFT